ncbi:hypothetical protein FB451DRAFT_1256406 [Mycena latifolia]|nr:hypothetical protein FB451DRAFT_1256406 [Mycena latifolia]
MKLWLTLTFSVFDCISTGLIAPEGVYSYVVPNFGSMLPLANLNPSLSAECCMSVLLSISTFLVIPRGFAKYLMSGLVAFFGTVSFGCVVTMFTDSHNILTDKSYQFSVFVGIAKGFAALADVIATGALCCYIGATHSSTGFSKTSSMLKHLIGYILQRGILVTLIQVTFLVIFFTTSTKFAWLALHVNVTRIYANTFCALNGRASLRSDMLSFNAMSSSKSGTYNNNSKELKFMAAPNASLDKVASGVITISQTTEYSSAV